jgi:hypothetical protein
MKEFLRKVIEGNKETPSDVCLNSFNQNFEDAINVEWYRKENNFEAIFYKNNLEHIAIFGLNGLLSEYRLNITPDYLPEAIKNIVLLEGEIMNSLMRNKGNKVEYEVIVRDKQLNRNQITISDLGRVIENRRL